MALRKNRLIGSLLLGLAFGSYDAAGNASSMPGAGSYVYDAENHLLSAGGVTYTYDGDGKRVMKSNGAIYFYGAGGDVLDETDLHGNLTNEYVFFNGARIARRDSSGNVFYYLDDQLGTAHSIAEVSAGQTTATLCYDADFYPFGGERWYTDSCDSHFKFTGKERDTESNLDNFEARYFSSQMGRMMSPDPSSIGGDIVDSESPQSWNMYSYVLNNPLSATDPDGLDCIYINNDTGQYEGFNRGDCDNSTTEKANSGYYVNGTVDTIYTTTGDTSGVVTGYSGTNNDSGTSTLISGTFNPSTPQTNSDALNPFAQGVFSQLNQMNLTSNIFKIYGLSVAVGATGGAACYYFCPEAGVTTLGLEGAGEAGATPGQASSISRTAAQGGRKAVERALRSYEKRLAEHEANLANYKAAGGYTSSVESEINNFKGLIQAAQDWLSKNP